MKNKHSVFIGFYLLLILVLTMGCNLKDKEKLIKIKKMKSEYVDARNVDIWLPPSYSIDKTRKYPVIYMHDGQNLFDSTQSYGDYDWGMDGWIKKLSSEGLIHEVIVVGIWNTPKRFREYMPDRPFMLLPENLQNDLIKEYDGKPLGDAYLKFIVKELKPFVDNKYRTMARQEQTFMMGSSMGGLITAYAICEYPGVFSGVACLSTHWPLSLAFDDSQTSDAFINYLSVNLPSPENHKIYFDYGTKTLDALYEPHQNKIDSVMQQKGYSMGNNWMTYKIEGAEHNEYYWNKRLEKPLLFLLGK